MQSRKIKPQPNITEAAEKTGLLIRGLQSRLLEGSGEVLEQSGETTAELEKQLQEYFADWPGEQARGAGPLNRIRNRVIDGVAERILRGWQQDGTTNSFEHEVIERLIEGVLQILAANGNGAGIKTRAFPTTPKSAATQLQA